MPKYVIERQFLIPVYHDDWSDAIDDYESARATVQRFLGAGSPEEGGEKAGGVGADCCTGDCADTPLEVVTLTCAVRTFFPPTGTRR